MTPNVSSMPKKGQRYIGWGKTWEVTRVFTKERVVEAVNVADPANRIRWPMYKFRTMERS